MSNQKDLISAILGELLVNAIHGVFLYREIAKLNGMTSEEINAEYLKAKLEFEKRDALALLKKLKGET